MKIAVLALAAFLLPLSLFLVVNPPNSIQGIFATREAHLEAFNAKIDAEARARKAASEVEARAYDAEYTKKMLALEVQARETAERQLAYAQEQAKLEAELREAMAYQQQLEAQAAASSARAAKAQADSEAFQRRLNERRARQAR